MLSSSDNSLNMLIHKTFPFSLNLDPPISTEHCDWLYGIFGHETSCTRYWTCWNGTATEQFCIGGLLYNEDTHACDWPQNVAGCQKHRKLYSNNTLHQQSSLDYIVYCKYFNA